MLKYFVVVYVFKIGDLEIKNNIVVGTCENINKELEMYSDHLAKLPQIVGANKMDLAESTENYFELEAYCQEHQIPMFPISAATGEGVRDLLNEVIRLRDSMSTEKVVFEKEYDWQMQDAIEKQLQGDGIEIEIEKDGSYVIYGPVIDKMLGYTHLDSEKGFDYFQKFLRERGVIARLEEMGIKEGDTVIVDDTAFE